MPVDVVLPDGYAVLKADDPLVAGMSEFCKGKVIFFARDPSDPVVSAHRRAGGRAAFVRDGAMVLAEGPREEVLARLVDVPMTFGGRVAFQVENALAAASACWGLGLPPETIRAGLASFDSDPDRTPGRFNVLNADGATIILDFGHNPSAMQGLVESLSAFPGGRRTLVLSAAGDRSDAVIVRQARILADAFDEVILYDEESLLRGRGEGEINDLLRRGLADGSRVSEVQEVHGEQAAIARALDHVQPGDLLLILLDDVEMALPFVRDRLARKAAAKKRKADRHLDDLIESHPSEHLTSAVSPLESSTPTPPGRVDPHRATRVEEPEPSRMRLRTIKALRGPNIWSTGQVLEAWVELGRFHGVRPDAIEGFVPRLLAWLPGTGRAPEFPRRVGRLPGRDSEAVARELQTLAWKPVGSGASAATSEPGVVRVAIPYLEEALARECLTSASAMLQAASSGEPFDAKAELARLRKLAQEVGLGPSTAAIVDAAQARGIPTRRLAPSSLVQLGHGAAQRRIWTAETDRTSAIAESIAQDKDLTRTLLQSIGVPVPEGRPVDDADDAWDAAEEIGAPVVVKPQDGNHGRGVATNLTTREQVLAAFAAARAESERDHRRAVRPRRRLPVAGRRRPARRRRPPRAGRRSSATAAHDRPARRPGQPATRAAATATRPPSSKIRLDAIALAVLAEQGTRRNRPAGRRVRPVPPQRQPQHRRHRHRRDRRGPPRARRPRRRCGACRRPGHRRHRRRGPRHRPRRSRSRGAASSRSTPAPGLRMHLEPSSGTPRPVGEAIVDMMFPDGETGRIPIVGRHRHQRQDDHHAAASPTCCRQAGKSAG